MIELNHKLFKKVFINEIGKIHIEVRCDPRNKKSYIKKFYNKDCNYLGDYNSVNKIFFVSHNKVSKKFESGFGYEWPNIRNFIKYYLEYHYKINNILVHSTHCND